MTKVVDVSRMILQEDASTRDNTGPSLDGSSQHTCYIPKSDRLGATEHEKYGQTEK